MSRQPTPSRKTKQAAAPADAKPQEHSGARSFIDELIFLCVIVMFFRMFVVEIYKIPSGSMTPTLLGGRVAKVDVDQDGVKELLFFDPSSAVGETQPLVYKWNGERFIYSQRIPLSREMVYNWQLDRIVHEQFDRILVSKIPYMFHPPKRGDIVVFKVPESIFVPEASIYIKRVAGLPGETITFAPTGRLMIDGRLIEQPDFYKTQLYGATIQGMSENIRFQPEISYLPVGEGLRLQRIVVPSGKIYVFGDNTHGSADSRYWGGVPIPNIKGQAFMRIWPITQLKFLR